MPPPLPSALLKSVTFLPRHPHHLPPPTRTPPLIYGTTHRKPSCVNPVPTSGRDNARSSAINSLVSTRKDTDYTVVPLVARSPGEEWGWWRMRPNAAGDGLSAAGRRWVAGGPDRGGEGGGKNGDEGDAAKMKVVGSASLHQFPKGEGEVEVNASCGGQRIQQHDSGRLLTIPTVLTLGRVVAVPLFVSTFYMNGSWATTATTSIFLAAAVTDWLDGYIARKMRLGTAFGAFLDPVADKLMVAATLVLLCTRPLEVAIFRDVPWLLTVPSIAIIGREITMSAVREWAASQDSKVLEAVAVNKLGKWKTATQMTALTILLATRDPSLSGSGVLVASGVVLLYISAGLALWSLLVYVRNIWRFLL